MSVKRLGKGLEALIRSDQNKEDNNRQKKIIQTLGCNVYRIKVKDGNLNKQLDNLFTYINELIQSKNPKMIWRC